MNDIRWIPVSERLPESPEFVLITGRRLSDQKHLWVSVSIYMPKDGMWSGNYDVLAWAPMPEPYKEPTVETVPVRHGYWTRIVKQGYAQDWFCSVCGETGRIDYAWCPRCGARMDKETEE